MLFLFLYAVKFPFKNLLVHGIIKFVLNGPDFCESQKSKNNTRGDVRFEQDDN